MKYGYFDDISAEYVITRPDTPLPWTNYLGSDGFFSLISNTCGGYSFYKDAKLRRITRFRYNNVPADEGGRLFYVCDGDTVWSPAFRPAMTPLDAYRCRHGLGYSVFEGKKNGVSAALTVTVPLHTDMEVQKLVLVNESDGEKELDVYGGVEWCLWNAVDDQTNFQRNWNIGEVEVEGSTVYHKTEYRERRNHYAFYSVNAEAAGFDTDRDAFLGQFRGWKEPLAVEERTSRGSLAAGWAPVAVLRLKVRLAPGERKAFLFRLGYAENPEDEKFSAPGVINKEKAKRMLAAFETEEQFDAAAAELKAYWTALLSRFSVKSSEDKLDRIFERFYQSPSHVNDRKTGTGIGLDLTRSLVELHHGTIEAHNNIGEKGCEFIVTIPLGYAHLKPEEMIEEEVSQQEAPVAELVDVAPLEEDSESSADTLRVNRRQHIIVVEDDVLASRFFLRYMDAALERYAGDPRIWCVNGWRSRYLNVLARPSDDVALVPRNASSGWGTWRDRWCEVDFSIPGWEVFKADPASMARLVATGADLPGMMEDFWPGRPDVWDVPCTYHMVRHGLFAVEPRLALTKNIGFDGNGLHSRPGDVLLARAPFYDFMPSLPERLAPDPRYLAEWSRALCSLAPSVRIKRKFLRLLWRFGPRHDTPVGQGGF